MSDNTKLTGINNRGTGSTSVGPSRIATIPPRPADYEEVVNTGQVMGMEAAHVLMPSSAKEFMARARSKHQFLINYSDRLLADSELGLLEAQSMTAGTLLNMEKELERRLNEPYGLSQFIGVAWPETDPLAGLVESAYPFSHSDRWQEYVNRFQKAWSLEKERGQRLKPRPSVPELILKAPEVDAKPIEDAIRGLPNRGLGPEKVLDPEIKGSRKPESDLPNYGSIIADAALALIGEAASGNAALAAGLAAPAISVVFYFIGQGQAVQKQHRNAYVSGVKQGAKRWVDSLWSLQAKQERGKRPVAKVQFNVAVHMAIETDWCKQNPSCWLNKNITNVAPAVPGKIKETKLKAFQTSFEKMNQVVRDFEKDYLTELWDLVPKELQKLSYQGKFSEIVNRLYLKHVGAARLKHMQEVQTSIVDRLK
ncbi:hypothetical protein [Lunatibacter salilacus]|uniref:hypothetical protein n=1 Tax=Lunatibacter salilacus TaxID=2483804 RepID=UPI00131BA870|nr:hypothetical protein [Lunatibacter salilacus]